MPNLVKDVFKDYKEQNNILNAEMTIIPLSLKYNKYQSGYYNISVRYNLDKYNQHQFKKITKILIK